MSEREVARDSFEAFSQSCLVVLPRCHRLSVLEVKRIARYPQEASFMRHPIEKSPRDGTAKDPTEAVEWVGENGEPSKITPTHWYPLARDQYRLRENERSLLAASSFIVILGATTLIATHFSAEVAAYVTRYTGHEVISRAREPVGEPRFAEEQLSCPTAGRSRSGQRASGSAASCAGAADRGWFPYRKRNHP